MSCPGDDISSCEKKSGNVVLKRLNKMNVEEYLLVLSQSVEGKLPENTVQALQHPDASHKKYQSRQNDSH